MRVNRVSRARTRTALAAFAVAGLTAGAAAGAGPATAQPKAAPAAAPDCSAAYRIEQKLSNGTTWRMCWRHEAMSGMVLEDITYQPPGESKPIKVLNSSKIAQIHVPYDDGSEEYDDVTGYYFGDGLENLAPGECPGGTIRTVKVRAPESTDTRNVKGLCTTTRARGHAYRMLNQPMEGGQKLYQKQGKDLLVYAVNKVSWYEYITEWRFSDDGTIHMNAGATGSLAPQDYDAADGRGWPIGKGPKARALSHSHNVFWKLNFALDGSSKGRIEQYDSKVSPQAPGDRAPTNKTTRTQITKEAAGDAKNMRWWRVVSATGKNKDGHPRSYELVAGPNAKYTGRAFTKHDVYFTQYNKCEQYASNNKGNCPTGHPKSVDKWVDGQALTNPVMWVNVGFHHIARDEDQQPMPVHWQGFSLAPRDVTAMNPLTPAELAGANGRLD
ncbi:Monoamine oxidase [Streptomyces davaonensis JCM 4913]|uniref:Amine oxidase n=1 Tax=Streptomyces davaonensis (strain DSM 101723 / JCM 4913 / KCC S-0913 / 768) TaxID=1214101 RepID=K4R0F0_STRDJ|nr:monoamine oxidase [Streptomyces davaonensis]CCK26637.1 Monoamine oxidase [Streptomyces davaonensis JCM 4913]